MNLIYRGNFYSLFFYIVVRLKFYHSDENLSGKGLSSLPIFIGRGWGEVSQAGKEFRHFYRAVIIFLYH